MGLIMEDEKFVVLSDIMGDEDHLGDMDFKVAGTDNGITALQMDIKISGITQEIMEIALNQAKEGRLHILSCMAGALDESRPEVSNTAPRITSIKISKDKIGELIGPGGKVIKDIIEKTGAKIDISDDGTVNVAAITGESMQAALNMISGIVMVPEIGKVYEGKVQRMLDFGVIVGLSKSTDGMVHISEMADVRIASPKDLVQEGDIVKVKVLDIDKTGRIKLSMKGLDNGRTVIVEEISEEENSSASSSSEDSEAREGSSQDRGDRRRKPRPKSSNGESSRSEGSRGENNRGEGSRSEGGRNEGGRGGKFHKNIKSKSSSSRDRDDNPRSSGEEPATPFKKKRFF
jgi:polyribonucleotide nucleotidyltransferase